MEIVPEKLKVDELRNILISKFYVPEEICAISNKTQLIALLKERMAVQAKTDEIKFDLSQCEPESSDETPPSTLEQAIGVKYGSPEWHEYVISQFTPDELVDGCPKCNGMRRVAGQVLGDITNSGATSYQVVNGDGGRCVVVNYSVTIDWKLDVPVGYTSFGSIGGGGFRTFGGLADCTEDNTIFGKHPAATAESKAEARALRKALCINVVTAEEKLTGACEEMPKGNHDAGKITKPLEEIIKAKAKALGFDLTVVLKEKYPNAGSVSELKMAEGRSLFDHIVEKYQKKS